MDGNLALEDVEATQMSQLEDGSLYIDKNLPITVTDLGSGKTSTF